MSAGMRKLFALFRNLGPGFQQEAGDRTTQKFQLLYNVPGERKPNLATLTARDLTRIYVETWEDFRLRIAARIQAAQKRWQQRRLTTVEHETRGMIQQIVNTALAGYRQQVQSGVVSALDKAIDELASRLLEVGTEAFEELEKINLNNQASRSQFLPDYVRLASTDSDTESVILEIPPQVRTLLLRIPSSNTRREVHVSLPYVVLGIQFHADNPYPLLRIFYRNAPLTSMTDRLYGCNLPNIVDGRSKVCLGNYRDDVAASLQNKVTQLLDYFWQSKFALYSYGSDRKKAVDERLSTLERWESESRQDPRFILQVDWEEEVTLSKLWSELRQPPTSVKNKYKKEVSRAMVPAREELKTAIAGFCQSLRAEGLFSKDVATQIGTRIQELATSQVDEILRHEAKDDEEGSWERFLDLLQQYGRLPRRGQSSTIKISPEKKRKGRRR